MGPADFEPLIDEEPFRPLRGTRSGDDRHVIDNVNRAMPGGPTRPRGRRRRR